MKLNEWFTQRHAMRLQMIAGELLSGKSPIIVRSGDELVFLYQGVRQTATVRETQYHEIKSVVHVPVALYLWLSEVPASPLVEQDRTHLTALREQVESMRKRLPPLPTTDILAATDQLLCHILDSDQVEMRQLQDYERVVEQPIRACMEKATRLELEALHQATSEWLADVDELDQRSLRVVVCGGHQARYKQASLMYFQRLLGESPGKGAAGEKRVVYAENCDTVDEAIELLATQSLDRELGAFFLSSPLAMQEDILGDAAKAVLAELLPQQAG